VPRLGPSGWIGALLVGWLLVLAAVGPLLAAQGPLTQDVAARLQAPSGGHLLGTDELGRDVLSRLLWGARVSLGVGVAAVVFALLIGSLVGLVAGGYGHWVDDVLMRLMDVLLAFPGTLLAIGVVAVRGPGLGNTLVAIGVIGIPHYARLIRSDVLSIREREFVAAARCIGAGNGRILFRHVLPNAVSPVLVQATLGIGAAITQAAGLGFLGLGAQPPTPEWGEMLSSGYVYLLRAPWAMLGPSIALILTVVGFNLVGDALRDTLDPRSRTR